VAQAAVAQSAEQWQNVRAADSRHKDSGEVKVRVTSTKEQSAQGRKVADFETRLPFRVCSAKAQTSSREPSVPAGAKRREGAEPSYFVCHTMRADRLLLGSVFLLAGSCPARIATGQRFAPGRPVLSTGCR